MNSLENAVQLKAELDSLRPLDSEAEARIMQKFRLDWNYHSNKLEGNSYTYGETKMLLLYGLTAGGKPVKDHEEISGHNEAIETLVEVIKDKTPLTETFIRHLHKLILVKPEWVEAKTANGQSTKRLIKVGEYKTEPNHVETIKGEMFYFAEPIETPAKMQELIEWFNEKKEAKDTNPIILATEFHYKFILIHPFDDGNGRMARLLMNFILMQNGFPPVIIKDKDKEKYIAVLRQADFGILEPFIEYISENLIHSLEIMIKGAKGESIEEPDDLDKELALLEQEFKSFGSQIVKRSFDNIINILENSIDPLLFQLINTHKKFDRFYVENKVELFRGIEENAPNSPQKTKTLLTEVSSVSELETVLGQVSLEKNPSILLYSRQHKLNRPGFEESSYISSLKVIFEEFSYKIRESGTGALTLIEKRYSEQLTSEEIFEIVNKRGKAHKNFIQQTIKKIKDENSN